LILVGSVAVAFLLIGLAVVFNAALFAGTTTDGATVTTGTGEVGTFNDEVRRDTRSVVIYANHDVVYTSNASLDATVRGEYRNYSGLLGESYAENTGAFVNVSYVDTERRGRRLVQSGEGNFTDDGTSGGTADWEPLRQESRMGWFVLNLNATATSAAGFGSGDAFELTVENATDSVSYRFRRNDSANQEAAAVDIEAPAGSGRRVTCLASDRRVLVDVLGGRSLGGSCEFNGTRRLSPPYTEVRFENGDAAVGKYSLVVNRSVTASTFDCPAPGPCNTTVVWAATVETTYRTERVEYTNTQNVTVYDPDR
jgi:hypothetical protein